MDPALLSALTLPQTLSPAELAMAGILLVLLGVLLGWLLLARPARRTAEAATARAAELDRTLAAAQVRGEQASALGEKVQQLDQALADQWAENAKLEGALEAEQRDHRARVEELRKAEERIAQQFRDIATQALGANSARFLELVSERFKAHSGQAAEDLAKRKTEIEGLVKPLAEQLGKFEGRVGEIEKVREGAYQAIKLQVEEMRASNQSLKGETAKLVQALRAPKTRGRWGEMQLKRVFEIAGMVDHVDFVTEHQIEGLEGAKLRPDAIVRLPGGKSIVIDAKTPLDAYLNALEAADPAAAGLAMAEHARQVKTHVKQLAAKEYWARLSETPDFVVMFVPGETFYAAAMEEAPSLFEDAFRQRVLIATPTTLIALVKAIAYGWQQEKLAKNAQKVADNARDLYERLSTMGGHLGALGAALKQSVDRYNKTLGSLERRVLPAARRFEDLGVALEGATLEAPDHVEVEPGEVGAPELIERTGTAD
ncbi:MAG: DNA recombination protein RmuC [Pseudomonadota bacterium]